MSLTNLHRLNDSSKIKRNNRWNVVFVLSLFKIIICYEEVCSDTVGPPKTGSGEYPGGVLVFFHKIPAFENCDGLSKIGEELRSEVLDFGFPASKVRS